VLHLERLDESNAVPRAQQTSAELDVFDARLSKPLVEASDLDEGAALQSAAPRPEGRSVFPAVLVDEVMQ
jgi:hypothetical protein